VWDAPPARLTPVYRMLLARRHAAICGVNHREQAELEQQHAELESALTSAATATDAARGDLAQARVRRTEEEEYEVCFNQPCPVALALPSSL